MGEQITYSLSEAILTFENHYIEHGFSSWFISQLAIANIEVAIRSKILGINEVPPCGSATEALENHGLDEKSLLSSVLSHCEKFNV